MQKSVLVMVGLGALLVVLGLVLSQAGVAVVAGMVLVYAAFQLALPGEVTPARRER
ncbi:hypothetical protein [Actinokineospora bangkokensis]|uniref:hypothetical protein n=1 Tax=Actinokineospora bangkokensis TaxID=1193682 RepID=UPI001300EED4|nr:hypothetical protein [Actinokineospora bangkokensis]